MKISFTLNNKKFTRDIKSATLLIDLIRDGLKLKGTKPGCLEGECGACTVLVNGSAINSCLYLAINIDGKKLTTIEGLSTIENPLDQVQQQLIDHGGVQCGFCTSGMALSIKSFSDKCRSHDYKPTRDDVTKSLEGNLCRCTGYVKIIDAAEAAHKNQGHA